jgi:hypothetical protein
MGKKPMAIKTTKLPIAIQTLGRMPNIIDRWNRRMGCADLSLIKGNSLVGSIS